MGTIRRSGTSREQQFLHAHHTVGRGRHCELVIERSAVSVQHAVIRFLHGTWAIRDLGSRNGTYVNGQRVSPGANESRPLQIGDEIVFAERDELWQFIDDAAPGSLLVPLDADGFPDTGRPPMRLEPAQVLALPTASNPVASVYQSGGTWRLEATDEVQELVHGQKLEVGGEAYTVHVANAATGTVDAENLLVERLVRNARLEVKVSPDEESAAATVRVDTHTHELDGRAFLYLLAYLGRERLRDVARGIDDADAGWVPVGRACDDLQLSSPEALGLLVHRCRRAIQDFGLDDPANIVDRSRRGLLRIGVPASQLQIRNG